MQGMRQDTVTTVKTMATVMTMIMTTLTV